MKKDQKTPATADRRAFLKLAGLGAAAGGAAIVATTPAAAETVDQSGGEHSLYQETEHVKRFYDLAREM